MLNVAESHTIRESRNNIIIQSKQNTHKNVFKTYISFFLPSSVQKIITHIPKLTITVNYKERLERPK